MRSELKAAVMKSTGDVTKSPFYIIYTRVVIVEIAFATIGPACVAGFTLLCFWPYLQRHSSYAIPLYIANSGIGMPIATLLFLPSNTFRCFQANNRNSKVYSDHSDNSTTANAENAVTNTESDSKNHTIEVGTV